MTAAMTLQDPPAVPSRFALQRYTKTLLVFPVALVGVFTTLLAFKTTRAFAVLMCEENYPVEVLTFPFLLLAGGQSWLMARRHKRMQSPLIWRCFYLIFSLLLFLTAMEEISWGQWFFHFHTPPAISDINTQHEFNLHNIKGMGGHTEYLRLTFGVGGLIGLALSWQPAFRPVSVPRVLWTWFVVITTLAAGDLYCDYHDMQTNLAKLMDVLSELVELMIAMAASLYLYLKSIHLPVEVSAAHPPGN